MACSLTKNHLLRVIEKVPAGTFLILSLGVAACGGGGGSSSGGDAPRDSADPMPSALQSSGGIWAASFGADPMTMFISEAGELAVFETPLAFGSGAVVVTDSDKISGSYTKHTPQTSPSDPRIADQSCAVDGVVRERSSLTIKITCEDADGNVAEQDSNLVYVPDYESPSSLDAIAGNYTLPFNQDTNSLSISNNGEIFGTFHNGGANCVVNGEVEIIDPDFALYRFTFDFANCSGAFTEYEGATMTGLGVRSLGAAAPPGAFLLMISGVVESEFRFFSVQYEPS
jgi:hypothetical protein